MIRANALIAAIIGAVLTLFAASAVGDPADIDGQAGSDAYEIIGEKANQPSSSAGHGEAGPTPTSAAGAGATGPVIVEYRWVSVCVGPLAQGDAPVSMDCGAARVCARPNERLYRLWGRTEQPPTWSPLSTRCFGEPPTAADTPRPQVTPGLVLNEIRRIGLPTLQAMTQPEGRTLVNFDTIFYTDAQPFATTVSLLGQQVDIVAEPTQYLWHHGDGSATTTETPGAPYPSTEITYRYTDAKASVRPRVDVTYAARFRVNGGAWQDIDETVTITGPESDLMVSEAAATLSGNYG